MKNICWAILFLTTSFNVSSNELSDFYEAFYKSKKASISNIREICISVDISNTGGFEIPIDKYTLARDIEQQLKEQYKKIEKLPPLSTRRSCAFSIFKKDEYAITKLRNSQYIGLLRFKLTMSPDAFYAKSCWLSMINKERICGTSQYIIGTPSETNPANDTVKIFKDFAIKQLNNHLVSIYHKKAHNKQIKRDL